MTHIMLDTETLGVRPGAVVMSVALVRFSDLAAVQVNLNIPEQQALGLEVDPVTHAWWGQQSPEAWRLATCDPLPVRDALEYVCQWIKWASGGAFPMIWAHGATFDPPILTEVYRRLGAEVPWRFWDVRDTRTLYDLAGVDVKAPQYIVPPPHVAINDALAQTKAANDALRVIAGVRGLV